MITLQKRAAATPLQAWTRQVFCAAASLATGAAIIAIFGYNPLKVYFRIIAGSLGSAYSFKETIQTMIPIFLMALGVIFCLKIQFISIGTEGQFYIGALAATYFALRFPELPAAILLPAMFAASLLGGGIWCVAPALMKLKLNVNETLVTLMMNYIAIKIVAWLQFGPWKDPRIMGYPVMPAFSKNAVLPTVLGIHAGWIIALALYAASSIVLRRTKFGFKIAVMGESPETARYAGFNASALTVAAAAIGGGLCGIAGFIQASAIENSLTYQLSGGWGFTAIVVAWLSKLRPGIALIVSALMAILLQGCAYIQISLGVPYFMANIIQGIILFFVLGSDIFSKYKIKLRFQASNDKEAPDI
jgi:simple sugar transport system permease protein